MASEIGTHGSWVPRFWSILISVMSRDPQSLWITHIHAIAYLRETRHITEERALTCHTSWFPLMNSQHQDGVNGWGEFSDSQMHQEHWGPWCYTSNRVRCRCAPVICITIATAGIFPKTRIKNARRKNSSRDVISKAHTPTASVKSSWTSGQINTLKSFGFLGPGIMLIQRRFPRWKCTSGARL